jgi:YidC/Oxa1 family membrane protein insertase
MFSSLYQVFLYQPLLNLLVFFYNTIPGHDVGLAIILITILLKVILYPISVKALRQQKVMQDLQPKLNEIKERYKDDKAQMASATMELYRSQKVNPLASCLPLLIQLPILIAAYHVFQAGLLGKDFSGLYSFVVNPGVINTTSFGIIDWAQARKFPGLLLAVLAAILQYVQTKMLIHTHPPRADTAGKGAADETLMAAMNQQMLYFMPLFTVVLGYSVPAGLVLYWFVTTLLSLLQQWYFLSNHRKAENRLVQK